MVIGTTKNQGRRGASGTGGFALLDAVAALFVLATAAVTLAQLSAVAGGAGRAARAGTMTMGLAEDKGEQVKALAWGYDAEGREVTDLQSDVSRVPTGAGGGLGLTPSPPGTIDNDTPGFVDYLDWSGRWVGNGSTMPDTARYIRRWSITPLPSAPFDTFTLHVVVIERSGPGAATNAGGSPGRPVTLQRAELCLVRTRRAR